MKEVLAYQQTADEPDTLLSLLAELFDQIATSRRKFGILHPKKFVTKVKKENVLFDNMQQQDAHEFLNYLLNTIGDLLAARQREVGQPGSRTWIQDIFQGTLTNETRCLVCETVRSKDEDFLDLSVDIEQNTSLTHCLKTFSSHERLCSESKYYCEQCCSKQEATKRLRVKKLPLILALHLKRFKYVEQFNKFVKLSHRVVFPWELKLFNTSGDADSTDHMYDLIAVVVHCGSGPNRGHYITIVKSHGFWLLYDDDIVEEIEPHEIENYFGLTDAQQLQRTGASESGYILFYQCRNLT
ncbi:Ubiquitin carboxyl-terminal hydrolase 46 [Geodia barretti]|uniref:ubiquitinyl hydrolase 1 n=2 Tax=Geodia barretti TaxID=519541 RepID=A0AA35TF19_GEOBA|nr:Ubiquitin carboxyl-terminal hydrolase 46 [Geodia barretti]